MNFIQVLIVVCAVFAGFVAAQTPYKDCGSKIGTITKLNVSGCTANPCVVKKGTNVTFDLEFKANKDISAATASVHAIVVGVKVPYPLPDPNACHFMSCPVKAGTAAAYKANMLIQKSYPTISVSVLWELKDSDGEITCFEVPIKVES